MRKWYIEYGDINHIDSTFKVNIENFLLHVSLSPDLNGKGVPTSYAFMKSPSKENLSFFTSV